MDNKIGDYNKTSDTVYGVSYRGSIFGTYDDWFSLNPDGTVDFGEDFEMTQELYDFIGQGMKKKGWWK